MTDTWEDEGGFIDEDDDFPEDFPYDDDEYFTDDSEWAELDDVDDFEYLEQEREDF